MALDIRLACLKDAILENWVDLEAGEENGKLVAQLKEGVEVVLRREAEEPVKKPEIYLDDPRARCH